MDRRDLIGSWRNSVLGAVFSLRDDGSASVVMGYNEELANWEYVDATHWRLKTHIPPAPDVPSLENGGVDVTEYEVVAYEGDVMRVTCFDDEHEYVFRREPS